MDVVRVQTALLQGVGIGLPEIKQEFTLPPGHKESLGVRPELCHGLVVNFGADFIAFRACAGADAGDEFLWLAVEILLHSVNEVGCDASHCGTPGRVRKANGFTPFFRHEYERAVRTLTHKDESWPVCIQSVCLVNESRLVAIQGCGSVDLVQPGTLFGIQGLSHLLDGLISLVTDDMAIRATASGHQMRDGQGIQCPEMPCDPGVILRGQVKTTA